MERRLSLLLVVLLVLPAISILTLYTSPAQGSMDSRMEWTGLGEPKCMAIGDYDNDGFNDLAFSEYHIDQVTVYRSDGTTIIKQWTGLARPYGVAIGDYDNDGLNDLAFTEVAGGRLTVYKNDGSTVIKQWTGLKFPYGVAIGDYDNDGMNELAFTTGGPNPPYEVTVYESDGTTIVAQWTPSGEPLAVALGDYDNDGLTDLAFTEYRITHQVTVYKNDGTTVIQQWTGISNPYGVAIGDYDNDGLNDLAFTEYEPLTQITVYKSDGTTILDQWTGFNRVEGVALGDYNNDGSDDLSYAEPLDGKLTVLFGGPPEPTSATIDVNPDTLNLQSNGQWITCYVELIDQNVADIDICSIKLNNTISVDYNAATQIGDYDSDDILDLMVKFDRQEAIAWLSTQDFSGETGKSAYVVFAVTGEVAGLAFEGFDTIRVLLMKGAM